MVHPGLQKAKMIMDSSQLPKGPPGADRLKIEAVRIQATHESRRGGSPVPEQALLYAIPSPQPPAGPVVVIDPLHLDVSVAVVGFALALHLATNGVTPAQAEAMAGLPVASIHQVLRGGAPLAVAVAVAEALGVTIDPLPNPFGGEAA